MRGRVDIEATGQYPVEILRRLSRPGTEMERKTGRGERNGGGRTENERRFAAFEPPALLDASDQVEDRSLLLNADELFGLLTVGEHDEGRDAPDAVGLRNLL